MRLSDNGRKLIQGFEGLSLKAYPDADGYSIGYGHFLGKDSSLKSRVITREEAERLFDQDVVKYETAVSITTPSALPHEFDAMTSLAYNIGTAGFAKSTVARLHNLGDKAGAADAFRLWNKSQGAVHAGLVKRRDKERNVYLYGYGSPYSTSSPATSPPVLVPPPSPSMPVAQALETLESGPTPSTSSWPESLSPTTIRTGATVSAGSLAALALGWLLYRLIHR